LNVTETLWSVLKRMRKIVLSPTALKQLEDVFQSNLKKIPLAYVQNMYEFTPRRITAVLKAKVSPKLY
jgi:hypothetical protein